MTISWQSMAFWPPKRRAIGEEFLFWQPETFSGRIKLRARAIIEQSPRTGNRSAIAWARIEAPAAEIAR